MYFTVTVLIVKVRLERRRVNQSERKVGMELVDDDGGELFDGGVEGSRIRSPLNELLLEWGAGRMG